MCERLLPRSLWSAQPRQHEFNRRLVRVRQMRYAAMRADDLADQGQANALAAIRAAIPALPDRGA